MSLEEFERFRREILADPELQAPLMAVTEVEAFVAAVVRLAMARGYALEANDVGDAIQQSQMAWQLRRVP